jgi:protein-disulfide isomerase
MQKNNQQSIVSAILIAGVLIAGAILLKSNKPPVTNALVANNAINTTFQGRPVSSSDHIIGNLNAKIVIVEYSDLECPYCKVFHATMHKVVENNNGNIAWVYRHSPIAQLHPKSFHESEATECAFEQGGNDAFWKYIDRLFEVTPSNNGLDVAELPKIAEYVGLNVTSFNDCLASGKFTNKIQADIDDGVKAGVNGTPSSFILQKGKVIDTIPGAQPYESVMQRLSQIK